MCFSSLRHTSALLDVLPLHPLSNLTSSPSPDSDSSNHNSNNSDSFSSSHPHTPSDSPASDSYSDWGFSSSSAAAISSANNSWADTCSCLHTDPDTLPLSHPDRPYTAADSVETHPHLCPSHPSFQTRDPHHHLSAGPHPPSTDAAPQTDWAAGGAAADSC